MSRAWQFRIQDVLDAIAKVERYLAGLTFEQFQTDELRTDAVIRNLEIIGEAVNHIPAEIQTRYPMVPWIDIRNMRSILAHVYFGVNMRIVWDTYTNDLPALKAMLQQILNEASAGEKQ